MKNANNWKLIIVLIILILTFAGIRYFRSSRLKTNLPELITKIDSAKVTEIIIVPAREKTSDIHLVREGKKWILRKGNRTAHLEQGGANTVLQSIRMLRPQSMVTKRPEKWNDYSVSDSSGTHVKVLAGGSVEADLWIGRTGFNQGSGGMFPNGFTYVRLNGEDAVYTVDAFLDGQFNRNFNDWRDKSFVRFKRDSVDKIIFDYPADSSFVLEKKFNHWMISTRVADSARVTAYINNLEYKNLSAFAELSPTGNATASITFQSKNKVIVKLEAWIAPGQWTQRSSIQPDTYFLSDGPVLNRDVWKAQRELLSDVKK